ncbi:hypothetical protein Z945_2124 [Sulfitobacter noctilucae]|nr:hypothetical protein Z945_2124 [Sulfitobacter noctilucae]
MNDIHQVVRDVGPNATSGPGQTSHSGNFRGLPVQMGENIISQASGSNY